MLDVVIDVVVFEGVVDDVMDEGLEIRTEAPVGLPEMVY